MAPSDRQGQAIQPRREGRTPTVRLHLDDQRQRGLRDEPQRVRQRHQELRKHFEPINRKVSTYFGIVFGPY